MKCQTKAGNIMTNKKVNVTLFRTEFSATKILMWEFHVEKSTKSRYVIILGIDVLTVLGLNLKETKHAIETYSGPF